MGRDVRMGGPPAQVDSYISYIAADRACAEWIAWQLDALTSADPSGVLQHIRPAAAGFER
jgi:hypothetical protein